MTEFKYKFNQRKGSVHTKLIIQLLVDAGDLNLT